MELVDELAKHIAVGVLFLVLSIPVYFIVGGKFGTIVLMYSPVLASITLWLMGSWKSCVVHGHGWKRKGVYIGKAGRMLVFDFGLVHEDEISIVEFSKREKKEGALHEYSH